MTDKPLEPSNLARELKSCACFNIRSAARVVTGLYDKSLEPAGLRMTQLAILAIIRARGVCTMQSLAADLGLDPSTMTRTLQPLIDKNLTRIESTEEDARTKQIVLTSGGHKKLQQGYALWQTAQQLLREQLGIERFERIISDLAALNHLQK